MMTPKLKAYNRLELLKLSEMLDKFMTDIRNCCQAPYTCKCCEYRHLCADVYAALQFVDDRTGYGKHSES